MKREKNIAFRDDEDFDPDEDYELERDKIFDELLPK